MTCIGWCGTGTGRWRTLVLLAFISVSTLLALSAVFDRDRIGAGRSALSIKTHFDALVEAIRHDSAGADGADIASQAAVDIDAALGTAPATELIALHGSSPGSEASEPIVPSQPIFLGTDASLQLFPPKNIDTASYLAYTTHSGFHNQRIALENAIDLARLLNRTLLIPPAILGSPPIVLRTPWSKTLAVLNRLLLRVAPKKIAKKECGTEGQIIEPDCIEEGSTENAAVSWAWLVNITAVRDVTFVDRPDMSFQWIEKSLEISKSEFAYLEHDQGKYSWQFHEPAIGRPKGSRYASFVDVHQLATGDIGNARLLHLGSTFGSARLELHTEQTIRSRVETRRAMEIHNDYVLKASRKIVEQLGGKDNYLAVHLRGGDGGFLEYQEGHMTNTLKQFLAVKAFGLSTAQITELEVQYKSKVGSRVLTKPKAQTLDPVTGCAAPLRQDTPSLNKRIWIATDLANARWDPVVGPFISIFPCAMLLSDPQPDAVMQAMPRLVDLANGVILNKHLFAFVDTVVSANAKKFVGTKGSTFSSYIEKLLHPLYHEAGRTAGGIQGNA